MDGESEEEESAGTGEEEEDGDESDLVTSGAFWLRVCSPVNQETAPCIVSARGEEAGPRGRRQMRAVSGRSRSGTADRPGQGRQGVPQTLPRGCEEGRCEVSERTTCRGAGCGRGEGRNEGKSVVTTGQPSRDVTEAGPWVGWGSLEVGRDGAWAPRPDTWVLRPGGSSELQGGSSGPGVTWTEKLLGGSRWHVVSAGLGRMRGGRTRTW